ncbi:MAG TPA: hypothetical protein VGR82_13330 [Methylomirabilota bacterium]|jgi:hypothetical protein|nr:hypothetical protein [Methylomirabilota bacterium]
MVTRDWRDRAARMGRTTALLRAGHMPDIQPWSTRTVRPSRDPCITCADPLDSGDEAVEVFAVNGVRLLFHVECHDMWLAYRERARRRESSAAKPGL